MNTRLRQAITALSLLAVVAALATGCATASSTPPPPPDELTEQQKLDAYDDFLDQSWERVTSQFPDAERPDVDFVRYIDQKEWAQVIVDCLVAEGVDAKVSTDGQGGYESQGVAGQELPMAIAGYVCDAKYPTDPSLNQPLTDAEMDYIYDYYVQVLNPCLAKEGYKTTEPPSRQAFLDAYGTSEMWAPYNIVSHPGQDEWNRINRACPQSPPGLRGS
jgi:hypothetical protein